MYDELIKALRNMSKMGMKYGMAAVKMHEAANAIEKLCGLAASQSKDCSEAVAKYLELWAKQPRWIPVTERLPEFNENVLVYSAHSGLMCIDANIQFDRNATHWMPLPEPPKEK